MALNSEGIYSPFSSSQFVHQMLAMMKEFYSYPFFNVLVILMEHRNLLFCPKWRKTIRICEVIHISESKPEWILLCVMCDLSWWNSSIKHSRPIEIDLNNQKPQVEHKLIGFDFSKFCKRIPSTVPHFAFSQMVDVKLWLAFALTNGKLSRFSIFLKHLNLFHSCILIA